MVRYYLAAAALKSLSANTWTRRFYRDVVGNRLGARQRLQRGLGDHHIRRAQELVELSRRHGMLRDGLRMLELGSGWMHFYAIVMRMWVDVRVTLVDVWDNRQFDALQSVFAEFERRLDEVFAFTPEQRARAAAVLAEVRTSTSYDDLYQRLGFDFALDPNGVHGWLPDASYDLAFSFDVLEHVHRDAVPPLLDNLTRLLKPGGLQIHNIGIHDHLTNYDGSMSWKHYLRYPDPVWRRFFENEVQYINRIQRTDWLERFRNSGAIVLEERPETCPLEGVRIHPQFSTLDRTDLACIALTVVARKPD